MKYLIYNGQSIPENNFTINPLNRAFNYGDGLFETMMLKDGKLLFLNDHIKRLSEGLSILKIKLPESITENNLYKFILELSEKNNLHKTARVKLMVWRKPGGLAIPESSEAEFLITASEPTKTAETKEQAFVSERVKLYNSDLSRYKTLNFLPYILAGLEKKERNADEIILTDIYGNISEATTANIFWCIDDVLFTPSLQTGCIDGIMRKQIIRFCVSENIKVQEGFFQLKDLQQSELIFTSNVSGLSLIGRINETSINTQYTLYQVIKIGLDLL